MTSVNFLCRLCSANVNENGWFIFGDDGKKNLLQVKIRLYLHFLVSEDDDLPKVLCNSCVRKLNNVHRFATMALCMQDRLRSRLGLQALQNTEVHSAVNVLRSVSSEPVELEEEKADVGNEVMEVDVDPMSILGPEDDESDGYDDDGSENVDDRSDTAERLDNGNSTSNDTENSSERPETNQKDTTQKINNSRLSMSIYKVSQKQKPFVCTYCSRGFMLELSLRNHLWLHENPRSPSKLCLRPEEPKRKEKREKPAKSEGNRRKQLVRERAESDSSLVDEEQTNSKVAEGFENNLCGVCRKSFVSKSELVNHLESHYLQGKFGCSICCRVFWSKVCLEQHQTNHKVKHYTCKVCGRMYSTKGSLRQHLVTHSDIRPHKCTVCPKTFKRNQDLKFHLNQHTGERPYLCPFCPKAFASSGNCFSHRKRMHPEETIPKKTIVASGNVEG